jgi:predicted O-methyltransferase YrrM
MNIHRTLDRVRQWWRYPQPTWFQRQLLGLHTDSFDTDFTARRLASETSARFIVDHMRTARNFATDYDLHEWVSQRVDPTLGGLYLEFGVATGRTLNHWARLFPQRTIHGFDSFEGLPETWSWNFQAGHFRQRLPAVRDNCVLHQGWFNQTLPDFLHQHGGQIDLLHVDADLYSSASYVLEALASRIRPGTIRVFDEYLNFPGWEQDEHRAWQEFVARHNVRFDYLAFVSRHQQVAVRVESIG